MAHNKILKNKNIYDINTNALIYCGEDKSDKMQYFAVVAMSGHCKSNYFIPILHPVLAPNQESAIEYVKTYGRIKRDNKFCILGIKQIRYTEFIFLHQVNDRDPYLTGRENTYDYLDRRILCREYANMLSDKITKQDTKRKEHRERIRGITDLKTVGDFDERYVLQRYFAPFYHNGKLVYRNSVSMHALLRDYFTQKTIELGIEKGDRVVLSCYLQLFGPNNELNIAFENNHFTHNGKPIILKSIYGYPSKLPIQPKMRDAIMFRKFHPYAPKQEKNNSETDELSTTEEKLESGLERFNKRFVKYESMKKEK